MPCSVRHGVHGGLLRNGYPSYSIAGQAEEGSLRALCRKNCRFTEWRLRHALRLIRESVSGSHRRARVSCLRVTLQWVGPIACLLFLCWPCKQRPYRRLHGFLTDSKRSGVLCSLHHQSRLSSSPGARTFKSAATCELLPTSGTRCAG
jgi:hypothetical protein